MEAAKKTAAKSFFSIIPLTLLFLFCPGAVRAQYLIVDCTGADPSAYPSINAALPNATPGSFILVTGPCTENISLAGVGTNRAALGCKRQPRSRFLASESRI